MANNTGGAYPNGNPSFSYTPQRPPDNFSRSYKVFCVVIIILATMYLLAKLHCWLRSLKDAHRADDANRHGRRQPGSDRDHVGGGVIGVVRSPQPPAPASVAVEMVRGMGALVCTYQSEDGWPADVACAVCLAELADGDALRVLPVCMHYFHAACIGEWLRTHDTCPLCRAPLAPPATPTMPPPSD